MTTDLSAFRNYVNGLDDPEIIEGEIVDETAESNDGIPTVDSLQRLLDILLSPPVAAPETKAVTPLYLRQKVRRTAARDNGKRAMIGLVAYVGFILLLFVIVVMGAR